MRYGYNIIDYIYGRRGRHVISTRNGKLGAKLRWDQSFGDFSPSAHFVSQSTPSISVRFAGTELEGVRASVLTTEVVPLDPGKTYFRPHHVQSAINYCCPAKPQPER